MKQARHIPSQLNNRIQNLGIKFIMNKLLIYLFIKMAVSKLSSKILEFKQLIKPNLLLKD